MPYDGDILNPVPNPIQEGGIKSNEKRDINRAEEVRRDTDQRKNFTIKLIDIDTAIIKQLEKFQLQVVDNNNNIKVPIFYSNPEKWKSIQKDGVLRDYNGKIILPAIVFKRTTSEQDPTLMMFNRYIRYPVMKKYSEKNKYTPFNLLIGKNAPINEIFDVVMPDHMIFTYQFIIWTEYVEQMNGLVEKINFETEDYWGDPFGFRFRTKIDSFSHTIDLPTDQDRIVKTEFNLNVWGYLLPDSINLMKGNRMTTEKFFSPKKIILKETVVNTAFDLAALDKNREKWKNQNYPNLQADVIIPPAPVVVQTNFINNIVAPPTVPTARGFWYFPAPTHTSDAGQMGFVSYDNNYYYVYFSTGWKRLPISTFFDFIQPTLPDPRLSNNHYIDSEYYYIYTGSVWKRILLTDFTSFTNNF